VTRPCDEAEPRGAGRAAVATAGFAGLVAAFAVAIAPGASRAAPPCLDAAVAARAAEAVDARSVRLDDGRVVRLAGLEPFTLLLADTDAAEAAMRDRLAALVSASDLEVQAISPDLDRYGRVRALIVAGGALAQETLAGEGLAIAFAGEEAPPCFARILAAEAEARSARRGYWSAFSVPAASPEALRPRRGRFAIFEGTIRSVGTRRATTYLDFGVRWTEDVTLEIDAAERAAFGGPEALEKLAGARIRARGFLEEKSGPMLKVHSPTQLEILAPAPPQ